MCVQCTRQFLLLYSNAYNSILTDIVWSVFKDAKSGDIEEAVGEHLRHATTRLKRRKSLNDEGAAEEKSRRESLCAEDPHEDEDEVLDL